MKVLFQLLWACLFSSTVYAGVQQDYFTATVKSATRVRIVRIGPDKRDTGALREHTLLDSIQKKQVGRVAELIELIDPKTEMLSPEEEVWTGSCLTFGMAEYTIEFLRNDQTLLRYGSDAEPTFLTPMGRQHGPQGTDIMLDYLLSPKSAKRLLKFVGALKEQTSAANSKLRAPGR